MHNSKPHILIVDDDLLTLKSLEIILKKLDYDVSSAHNGEEALVLAKNQIFDLIVSDLSMPFMNGNELVKRVRKMTEYKYTPFIFLSGNNEEETWVKNLEDGADDFITKPFNRNILVSKIKANLKKANLRKEILKSNKRKNINLESGTILFCLEKNYKLDFNDENITTKVVYITDENELFNHIEKSNIWVIIIDENAIWAINNLEKLRKVASSSIPAYLFISDFTNNINIESYFDIGINGFIHKHKSSEVVSHQINSIVNREKEIKDKYLNAINLAANASPIRFENSMNQKIEDISVSILHEPFNEIPGGDFYEVFDFNDKKIIILGDVMGKKWGAWFFVLAYIAYIRSTINFFANNPEVEFSSNPERLLEIINQYIYKDLQLSEVFTTLSVIVIDTVSSSIRISSAGAMRPFFYNHTNEKMRQLNIVGTLLGVIADSKYQSINIDLRKGDKLLIFTDGYSEAKDNETGKMIGEMAMLNAFNSRRQKDVVSCQQIENEIIEEFHVTSFDDDRTMVLICKS